jgi:hypothetical protein
MHDQMRVRGRARASVRQSVSYARRRHHIHDRVAVGAGDAKAIVARSAWASSRPGLFRSGSPLYWPRPANASVPSLSPSSTGYRAMCTSFQA